MDLSIAEFVKQKRKRLKITQPELAERAGVGLRFIRELEQGKENLSLSKVKDVLIMFGNKLVLMNIKEIYSLDDMEVLAQKVIETSISVSGVQPKLSLGFIKDQLTDGQKVRLTVLDALE